MTMEKNTSVSGYFFAIIFCMTVAYSSIFIHETNQAININLSVFLTFLICTLWFNLANIKSFGSVYKKLITEKMLLFIVNLSTAVVWITTFEALKYIDPVLFIALFMGLMPVATYLIQCFHKNTKLELKPMLLFLLITLLLVAIVFIDKEQNSNMNPDNFYNGVIFTAISSIASGLYLVCSKQLESKLALTASQIVGVRFYLLVIYSGAVSLFYNYFPQIHTIHYSNFIFLAFLSAIIPMYCVQKSVYHLGALKTSLIIPFTPIFTYLLLFFTHQRLSKTLLPLLLALAVVLLYNAISMARPKKPVETLAAES